MRHFFGAAMMTIFMASAASASGGACFQVHHQAQAMGSRVMVPPADLESSESFFYSFLRISPSQNPGKIGEILYSRSRLFRDFYWQHLQIAEYSPDKISAELLALYHRNFFADMAGPQLRELRGDSLLRALQAKGITPLPGERGQQTLARLSRRNLTRLLGADLHLDELDQHPEILSLTQRLKLSFDRNSHSGTIEGTAVLSSFQLERYGLGGGYNSHRFNREIMKVDDNVFFHTNWSDSGRNVSTNNSYYGAHSQQVHGGYARSEGWISAFVMWPAELGQRVQALTKRPISDEVIKSLSQYTEGRLPELSPNVLATTKQYLNDLTWAEFTVRDFEFLGQELLGRSLLELKKRNPAEFQRVLRSSQEIPGTLIKILNGLMKSLGLDSMEMKIPVAVPVDQIIGQ